MQEGVLIALSAPGLFAAIVGVLLGLLFGAIPGLTATLGVALLVPVTFAMEPASGMIMLAGVYAGAVYAGTITGVLLNIPGTPASVPSTWEGYQFTRRGDAPFALGTAALSSGIGGLLSGVVLFTATPILASWALALGAPEYAAIAVFGIVIVAGVFDGPILRSAGSVFIGLTIALVGFDPLTGYTRLDFDQSALAGGLGLVPVLIGVFCLPEAVRLAARSVAERRQGRTTTTVASSGRRRVPSFAELRANSWNLTRSSSIGVALGVLPAVGPETAPFISYAAARRASKRRQDFGHGSVEGLMAAESSNNSNVGGSMIPLLALGVPGSAVAAVFVGALTLHGLRPGPTLFTDRPDVMYALFTGFLVVNAFMLLIGIFLVRHFALILRLPPGVIATTVMLFSVIGAFAIQSDLSQVWIMLGAGLLTAFLMAARIPVAPLVLALILGPLFEVNFRRALQLSQGDWMIFLERPISLTLIVLTILGLVALRRSRRMIRPASGVVDGPTDESTLQGERN